MPTHAYLHILTEGEEKDRPPILPPDLAANASPGAANATAATVAATASFFARSVVKASQGAPSSPPPPAFMLRGDENGVADCKRVREAVDPAKLATGIGKKAEAGPQQAAKMNRDVVLMLAK